MKHTFTTFATTLRLFAVSTIVCFTLGICCPSLMVAKVAAQTAEVTLKPKTNGFMGTYKPKGKDFILSLETYRPTKEFSLTRVQRQDKSTITEVLLDQDRVMLTIRDVEITFDL